MGQSGYHLRGLGDPSSEVLFKIIFSSAQYFLNLASILAYIFHLLDIWLWMDSGAIIAWKSLIVNFSFDIKGSRITLYI
jgi:hypothetical protein